EDLLRPRSPTGERQPRSLAPAHAVRIALAVCEGLIAAHAAGVVHRDLKPANILIEPGGRVVITDFGIARGLADDGGRTQGMVGTPLYMAPEQVEGAPVDGRTDLYALGLTLFEMLTGAQPFIADAPLIAALRRIEEPPPDPRTRCPELPAALAQIVLDCLAREPHGRPASAAALADRLRGWLATQADVPELASPIALPAPPVDARPITAQASRGASIPARGGSGSLRPGATSECALAVLPVRYQGPADERDLADAVTDALIDVLSRTGGLRVASSGATARFRDNRDPRAVGADLGVDVIVDATLQRGPSQVRLLARLVEVTTGVQLWSDRFELRPEDPFEIADHVSKRLAESLRVELMTLVHRADADADSIALYTRARRKLYAMHVLGFDSAVELLEGSLAIAPEFRPALAAHAVACVRAWFIARSQSGEATPRDLEGDAQRAVERALLVAPAIAETHLARGMLAVQRGEWREAVKALVKALELAPAYPHALQYLGQLQCEAGNTREGVARARLAADLEPSLALGLLEAARVHALHGELDEYERLMARIEDHPPYRFSILLLRMRVAAWFGDRELPRQILAAQHGDILAGYNRILIGYGRALLGDVDRAEMDAFIRDLLTSNLSPRLYTAICQLCVELHCARGDLEAALAHFRLAADAVLTDIEWVDRCPLLAPMRALPGFGAVRRTVRLRVDQMWML
ncbi:MAG TPA: protein kinase, partial [Nannocystis sp.]